MRLLNVLMARGYPKEPIPFQEILPLKLKTGVSGKGNKTSEVCCLHEMSVLFACLKKNEFNQVLCSKEIDTFQNCYKSHMSAKRNRKEQEAKGILIPGDKNLSPKQLNKLLKMFPNNE